MKKARLLKSGYSTVVFDCDSTLSEIEGIDFLAKRKKKEEEVKRLTKAAMDGKIRFDDVFSKRLDLVKPEKPDLDWLYEMYVIHKVHDAKKTIDMLQKTGRKVFIVSGGYRYAVEKFAKYLGVSGANVFAVDLEFDENGKYSGYDDKNVLTKSEGKNTVLREIRQLGSTLFVGDGVTDLEAKDVVDLFVGFGGVTCRKKVQEGADIYTRTKSLMPIYKLALGT